MSLFAAALVLSTASARIDSVYLTTTDRKLAVRVAVTGTPGMVAVHREGGVARVSVMNTAFGGQFAGGRRFSWTPSNGFDPALLAATPAKLDRIEIVATDSEVSLLLHVPPETAVEVKRDARGLLLVFASGPPQEEPAPEPKREPEPLPVAVAPTAPAPPPPAVAIAEPVKTPTPTPAAPVAAPPSAPAERAELARRLFPAGTGEAQAGASVSELYAQLFPTGVPQAAPAAAAQAAAPEPSEDAGLVLGPFRVRASIDARYADADIFVEVDAEPTRDRYLEVQPRVLAAAPVGAGAFTLEYSPVLRAFATYDQVNSSSHLLDGQLELPVGSRVTLRAGDRFQSGVLDTRVVDPGGEYFFGLGRFNRNDAEASASIVVGPRLSVELGAGLGHVHFLEDSSFFDYETRLATAGLGFELTPSLRAVASYIYDEVPRPDERPEAESTAHSARLALSGEILPLLSGELAVGYRSMDAPHAGAGGQSYSGLTLQASLQREFAREVRLALYATRSTPVSAFEENGFYVSTGVQGVLEVPLVARFEARGGLGYQWNDYQTIAQEIGAPREDRILGWFAALRRPIARKLALSAAYRREERRSNLEAFDTDASGFYLQLEWDLFGTIDR
ncbi:MAG TPA: outer membrane beta-barrel protein [Vicinamibacteria bacterium]